MLLRTLLKDIVRSSFPKGFEKLEITSICSDSRQVSGGSLFVAVPGANTHGDCFIEDAIKRGAKVITIPKTSERKSPDSVLILGVENPAQTLRDLALRFYDNPSAKLKTIGITGTNGKTTVTYLLESIFNTYGKSCGVIGTVNHHYAGKVFPSLNTTPGLIENQQFLAEMVKAKVHYCLMEVSSHALAQGRTDGIGFPYAIFTNLASDHLDYHKNREDYFLAKSKLFTGLSTDATAVINIDDEYGPQLVEIPKSVVKTYGIKNLADIQAKDITMSLSGSQFTIVYPGGQLNVKTPLIGRHNIYNILAAFAVALSEGVPLEKIAKGIEQLEVVPGRLERVNAGQDFQVFVDYAHTEDALKNVLTSLRQVNANRIILVFGCGGDRDKTKRPKMGQVASKLADEVIITNDNPRSEDPQTIANEILAGLSIKNYRVILNRDEAIGAALSKARSGDVVLVAGKGHEDYQIFKDRRISFKEHDVIKKHLEEILRRTHSAAGR